MLFIIYNIYNIAIGFNRGVGVHEFTQDDPEHSKLPLHYYMCITYKNYNRGVGVHEFAAREGECECVGVHIICNNSQ